MRDGIEAGTGETEGLDAKRESPVTRSGTRPNPWFTTPNPILEGVELREAYARIIDPMAWKVYDKQIEYAGEKPADPLADPQRYDAWHYRTGLADQAVAPSLAKADAILALPNPTAYARIREALEAGLKSEAIAIGFQWTAISPKGLAGALDFLAGRASEALKTTPLIGLSQGEGGERPHVMPGDPHDLGNTALQWYLDFQFGYPHSVRESNIAVEAFKDGFRAALSGLSLPGRDGLNAEIERTEQWVAESERFGRPNVVVQTADLRAILSALSPPISGDAALSTVQDGSVREEMELARADKLDLILAEIRGHADIANDVIRLGRETKGGGRVKVATCLHHIARLARQALSALPQSGDKI